MNNTTRALTQAISLDGWIGEFDADGTARVHVDVVFRQGAFGDDPTSQVRFKIALTKAEVILRIPDSEPLKVRKNTVERTVQAQSGTKTTTTTTKGGFTGRIKASLSPKPTLSGGADAYVEKNHENNIELSQDVKRFLEQHFTTPDGHTAWEVKTNKDVEEHLAAAPWDAVETPRLSVRKTADRNNDGDNPTLVVEVRCSREDIEIIDLEEKDPERQRMFREKKHRHKNLAAAEQLIKEELLRAGFIEIPDIGEQTSRLLIADKIIFEDS